LPGRHLPDLRLKIDPRRADVIPMSAELTVAGSSSRRDLRRELVVVDPRPLFANAIASSFDTAVWDARSLDPAAVAEIPIQVGIGLVALATPDAEAVVAVLAARDRRVIVYGGDQRAPFFETVAAGAVGFVSDRADTAEFVRVAEALRNGAVSVFPEHTSRRLAQRGWVTADDPDPGLGRLTGREREVLGGLMLGLRPAEIAERDFVSVTTVRNQVQAILTKLNVHSQLEAVAMANRLGWVVASA